jgi:hypothetical protein
MSRAPKTSKIRNRQVYCYILVKLISYTAKLLYFTSLTFPVRSVGRLYSPTPSHLDQQDRNATDSGPRQSCMLSANPNRFKAGLIFQEPEEPFTIFSESVRFLVQDREIGIPLEQTAIEQVFA